VKGNRGNKSTHPIHAAKKLLYNVWILKEINSFIVGQQRNDTHVLHCIIYSEIREAALKQDR
jgi:hypothetical protein